ncbi:unnamed protein product [Medioppia subpectinata]|uniref:Phosphoinositide-specific phospholipase C EF-hand-like domain-containing protein n=2 Tax=Medioppia subpectinata TaxID=1979941 RepID=A0A7R9KTH2_9ACAR|nr:unnamed protein product [Medioppia subpectinata]CAG2108330.1 unnamed protein product [Medioppia subpectinata]
MRGISFVRMDSKQTEKLIKVDEEVEERKKDEKIVVDIPDATANRRSRLRPKSARSIRGMFNDENVPNEEAIYKLNERTCFHKVRSLDKFVCRKYHIDLDTMQLHYEPSIKPFMCKDVPYYDLCDLSEVRKGWESDRYNVIESRFRRKLHASIGPKNLPQLEENNCFSLIFDNGFKTEDLVAPNVETRDVWMAHIHKHKMNRRDLTGDHTLDWEEFLIFYQLINQRPELDELFQDYSVNSTCIMGPEELRDFLIEEQKMTKASLADCEAYISRYEPKDSENPGYLSIKGLSNYFYAL